MPPVAPPFPPSALCPASPSSCLTCSQCLISPWLPPAAERYRQTHGRRNGVRRGTEEAEGLPAAGSRFRHYRKLSFPHPVDRLAHAGVEYRQRETLHDSQFPRSLPVFCNRFGTVFSAPEAFLLSKSSSLFFFLSPKEAAVCWLRLFLAVFLKSRFCLFRPCFLFLKGGVFKTAKFEVLLIVQAMCYNSVVPEGKMPPGADTLLAGPLMSIGSV